MLPVALSCLDAATADRLLSDTTALHDDHQRDAGDTLMMAYDRGTYTKVSVITGQLMLRFCWALIPACALLLSQSSSQRKGCLLSQPVCE